MSRTRGWRRKKNYSKASRKKEILRSYGCNLDNNWYKYDGQYIKGKIHCSCPMCSAKTNSRGRYGAAINYTMSDHRKIDSMEYQMNEYQIGNDHTIQEIPEDYDIEL